MCNGCNKPALWRCLDCQSSSPSCDECCRVQHQQLIFHRVQFWSGKYYEPSWLLYTGVVLHLGHQGNPCPRSAMEVPTHDESVPGVADASDTDETIVEDMGDPDIDEDKDWIDLSDEPLEREPPQMMNGTTDPFLVSMNSVQINAPAPSNIAPLINNVTSAPTTPSVHSVPTKANKRLRLSSYANIHGPPPGFNTSFKKGARFMTIIDRSGVHRIQVEFCQCPGSEFQREVHFLHAGLFPASFKVIKTAFTFAVLDDFRVSNLDCKTSGYHYYRKLRRFTSPSFPDAVPVRSKINYDH